MPKQFCFIMNFKWFGMCYSPDLWLLVRCCTAQH